MLNLVVILATAAIAAVMITAVVVADAVKNAAGGNSGKTKIAAAKMIAAVVDADATQDAVVIITAVAIAATS